MAHFTPSSSSSSSSISFPSPFISAASSSGAIDDTFEDACSICLEPFNTEDPATVTGCKHDYHLQCILEWSQRSKECPICWQLLVLKDLASQELLAAVQSERRSKLRNISPAVSTTLHNFHEDFDIEQDSSLSDDSDFDEHIMQHIAVAASRSRYVRRRERQRSSGLGPSQVVAFTSPSNLSGVHQTHTSPERCQILSYGSSEGGLQTFSIPSDVNVQPQYEVSSTAVNRDGPLKPRVPYRQPPPDSPRRVIPAEMSSFSESMKSKWSAASARYKESFSKGTRGLKEKLIARNNSVKELSKGVQREMSAGIAGVARMIDRLDLASKRTGASFPVSDCAGETSNFSFKGKGVQENAINKNGGEVALDFSPDAPPQISVTNPGRLEVSHTQGGL